MKSVSSAYVQFCVANWPLWYTCLGDVLEAALEAALEASVDGELLQVGHAADSAVGFLVLSCSLSGSVILFLHRQFRTKNVFWMNFEISTSSISRRAAAGRAQFTESVSSKSVLKGSRVRIGAAGLVGTRGSKRVNLAN